MKRGVFAVLLLLAVVTALAQRIVVSGTVEDRQTGKTIEGASVSVGGIAVVTNADGYFMLKTDMMPKHLMVTHIGYRNKRVDASELKEEGMKIRMEPATIELREVLVMAEKPRELVAAAIRKIPQNYPLTPELYRCFYRETAMKRQHYISVAEGVVDMYKTSYKRDNRRDRVAIRKGRRLFSPKQSDTLGIKVLGGPVAPIQLDVVKNTGFLLNEQELDYYDLTMMAPTSISDRQQFVIRLTPRTKMPYPLYYGQLYIDCETLAFTRVDMSLDMSDQRKATETMLIKKPSGVRFKPKEMSLLIDYRQSPDGLMRISYIRTTFRFNCDWRRRLFATSFTAYCEMCVTTTEESDSQPIEGRESFDQRDAFFDKVDFFRDPAFWQDYNIIEPTETLDRAIHRILKKY